MPATSINNIVINAITTAVNECVNQSISAERAYAVVREFRLRGQLDDKTARTYFQSALLSKAQAALDEYNKQVKAGCTDKRLLESLKALGAYTKQVTDKGFPAQGSAYQRAVTRLMAATAPIVDKSTPKDELAVPAEIQALADKFWAMCAEYEAAGKLAATALANAKAGK